MSPRLLPVLAALSFAASGCLPHSLDWQIGWSETALPDRAAAIEASISAGGCEGGTVVWIDEVDRQANFPSPPDLEAGLYGFAARARDTDCAWYAEGCVERRLPSDDDTVLVVLAPLSPASPACPPSECVAGECGGAVCTSDDCSCTLGGCVQECPAGGDCSCLGGHCNVRCASGASCSCLGGGCVMECEADSECTCLGGTCSMSCEEGATCTCSDGGCG